jgi:hypothetical protein
MANAIVPVAFHAAALILVRAVAREALDANAARALISQ